jgi:protein-tyrosine kinase
MERIQKAMELARAQRVAGGVAAAPAVNDAPSSADPAPVVVPLPPSAPEAATRRSAVRQASFTVSLQREVLRERRLVLPDERSAAAHAYRMLRAKVQGWMRGTPHRIIGIVSASEGEGKTLTAANLAMQLASEPGQSVALVEFDLRRPALARLFGVEGRIGIEAALAGSATVDEVSVGVAELERLRILPAGRTATASVDPLAGPASGHLLSTLATQQPNMVVIVDLPPALLSSDLLTLAPSLDAVLIVASEGRTRRDDLRKLADMLRGQRVIGTVLNMASEFERRVY